uniref:hypothetical protein n=1 Tax=Acidocella sp. C78 TaxID=1671486 RepID=UPI00191BB164|nr:hypothetical protein [Acidocella sp. C78]
MHVREMKNECLVSVPSFYPSGAGAIVSITVEGNAFRVSDLGFGYRESKMVGAEVVFVRRAKKAADRIGVQFLDRSFSAIATFEQLAATITDISGVSTETTHQAVARIQNEGEGEVASHLLEKLTALFGASNVESIPDFRGASSREWDITAVVKKGKQTAAFKAVGNHAMSVYYAHAALNDIALLKNAPKTISVVKNITEMGNLYNILAQVGDVIEEDASNEAFKMALAA